MKKLKKIVIVLVFAFALTTTLNKSINAANFTIIEMNKKNLDKTANKSKFILLPLKKTYHKNGEIAQKKFSGLVQFKYQGYSEYYNVTRTHQYNTKGEKISYDSKIVDVDKNGRVKYQEFLDGTIITKQRNFVTINGKRKALYLYEYMYNYLDKKEFNTSIRTIYYHQSTGKRKKVIDYDSGNKNKYIVTNFNKIGYPTTRYTYSKKIKKKYLKEKRKYYAKNWYSIKEIRTYKYKYKNKKLKLKLKKKYNLKGQRIFYKKYRV